MTFPSWVAVQFAPCQHPRGPRQVDVQQYPVGTLPDRGGQCLDRVRSLFEDFKAALSEQLGRQAEEACVVIDEQDPNRAT